MSNLDKTQVGDFIAVHTRFGIEKHEVTKATATQVCCNGWRFIRKSGKLVGGLYSYAQPWSNELAKIAETQDAKRTRLILCNKISSVNFRRLTLDQLQRIEAIINESKEG